MRFDTGLVGAGTSRVQNLGLCVWEIRFFRLIAAYGVSCWIALFPDIYFQQKSVFGCIPQCYSNTWTRNELV